jgi:peptidoglycan/LPS O-acetylase OafA/YrhL
MLAAIPQSVVRVHEKADSSRLPAYSVHMDAIRALAAFLVLAGHARMLFFGDHQLHAGDATDGMKTLGLGGQAVVVFFVLSGCLGGNSAWRAIRNGRWSWQKYLFQRMTRLWIVLLPALIFGGILDHLGMRYLSLNGGIYSAPPGQGMVVSNLAELSTWKVMAGNFFFLQKIRVPTFGTNAALWSLANEFWYYMLFPLLLLIVVGRTPKLQRFAYALLAAGIFYLIGPKISYSFLVWLLGFFVSIMALKIPASMRRPATACALFIFLAVITIIRLRHVGSAMAATLIGISFAVYLYTIAHARQPVKSLIYQTLATGFSRFSYTLYLAHLPLLVFLVAILNRPWQPWHKNLAHLALALLLVVVAYSYAWMMYYIFERNTDVIRKRIYGS